MDSKTAVQKMKIKCSVDAILTLNKNQMMKSTMVKEYFQLTGNDFYQDCKQCGITSWIQLFQTFQHYQNRGDLITKPESTQYLEKMILKTKNKKK